MLAYIVFMTTVTKLFGASFLGAGAGAGAGAARAGAAGASGRAPSALASTTASTAWILDRMAPSLVRGAAASAAVSGTPSLASSVAARNAPIEDARFEAHLRQSLLTQNVIASAMIAIRSARSAGRDLTATEKMYVTHAERAVTKGVSLALPLGVGIGGAGVRPFQTQISLADVGPGHLEVTLRDAQLLRGLILHHEHIDRESLDVAPYRMIAPDMNAKLGLHAAGQVPVTVYYGRPSYQASVKNGGAEAPKTEAISQAFDTDPTTPINTLAAAAEAIFSHGTADVKVAMDGLTAKQAIKLMSCVAAKTPRAGHQFFSAAFNLNRPLVDDRVSPPVTITDPRAIARMVPQIAKEGGWQKVTIDSASDKVPSTPLMELIGFETLVDFAHAAHGFGLETYISGGMRDQHFEDAVLSGVGGVGVGYSMHVRGAPHLVVRLADELGALAARTPAQDALFARALKAGNLPIGEQVALVQDAQEAGLLGDVKAAPNMSPDPFGGVVGPIDPAKILASARVRDDAEASLGGRAARLLAELDMAAARTHAGGDVNGLRTKLYEAIRGRKTERFAALLGQGEALGFGTQPGRAYLDSLAVKAAA